MKSSGKNISLTSYDDIFTTEARPSAFPLGTIVEIPLEQLHPFKNHPFRVVDDEHMQKTADSIRDYGVLVPGLVRPRPEGGYEIIAGHRRKRASEIAGKKTMPVLIRNMDDDEATIAMVDSNLQREFILHSERAAAYQMKLEALAHQGKRNDLTSSQVGTKLRADAIIAEEAGTSRNQVQRYIRLNNLIKPILNMVDSEKIAFIHTKGLDLSRFMLGTVQLGMEYGLGSDRAKPSYQKAFAMLDQAAALGINAFDTANNYGDAEYILGQWLEKRYRNPGVRPWIVTKIGPLKDEAFDNLRDDVRRQVDDCRWNLGVETIDCLMLHNYEDYEAHGKAIQRIFAELRGEHAFRYSAISAYSRHDYGVIAESGFDAVQIPLNIFDWGQIESGGIEKLAKANMMVFARSVFLQGLVFLTPQVLDRRMDFCLPALETFQRLCREFELSPAVLSLSFVLTVPGITTAVLGCDNVKQVQDNAKLFDQTVPLTKTHWDTLRKAFMNIDERVINPGVWFNHT